MVAVATQPAQATANQPDMSDQTISDKIDDELLFDRGVASTKLDVSTSDGIVTLTGKVNNILAKERAARIAETVKGVRSTINRIEVSPITNRSDARISTDVTTALAADPATESYEVTVAVVNGTAHLYGTGDSYFEKNRADDATSRVSGVLNVENHLLVDSDTAYIDDPYVDTFESDDELIDYERRAPLMTDSQIKDAIESELWWSLFVDSDEVSVAVDDGVATLTGTVQTWSEQQSATKKQMKAARRWSTTIWSSATTIDRYHHEAENCISCDEAWSRPRLVLQLTA